MSSAGFAPTVKARTALSTEVVAGTACQPLNHPLHPEVLRDPLK
jgi:hypothetical protein